MFLIKLLPEWLFYVLTFVGIIAIITCRFLQDISLLNKYILPIQLISVFVIIVSVWFLGGLAVEKDWKERVTELEKQVLIAKEESAKASAKVEVKYINKVKTIKEVKWKIKTVIKEKEKLINSECKIVPEVIQIHNAAALNEVIE